MCISLITLNFFLYDRVLLAGGVICLSMSPSYFSTRVFSSFVPFFFLFFFNSLILFYFHNKTVRLVRQVSFVRLSRKLWLRKAKRFCQGLEDTMNPWFRLWCVKAIRDQKQLKTDLEAYSAVLRGVPDPSIPGSVFRGSAPQAKLHAEDPR